MASRVEVADIGVPSEYANGSVFAVNSTASTPCGILRPALSPVILYLSTFGTNDWVLT